MILKEKILLPKSKEEIKKINIRESVTNKKLNLILFKSDLIPKKKKKGKRKILTKDKHYYKHNKELIKQKAKQKYREKMKNREYRFKYLAKQRGYNKKKKYRKCIEMYKLLYEINALGNDTPVMVVYDAG